MFPIKTRTCINDICLLITGKFSYKCITGIIGTILFGWYIHELYDLYEVIQDQLVIYQEKMNIFNDLNKYKVGYGFFNHPNISSNFNYEYINEHYSRLTKFRIEDLPNVQMRFDKLDLLVHKCEQLNFITTAFAIFLDVPKYNAILTYRLTF